ncbi:MAG TPA: DUF1697 domain-containing protein [Thermoanaerobaculia bacterium]|jgi:uncharacterized protein (DUF1697 family)
MPRYVAFLRAINVGGHTVTMAALRGHFEALGYAGVETVIASGNVVFDAASKSPAALERKIAGHLEARLGYAVGTFLRAPADLAAVAAHAPFPRKDLDTPGHGLYIGFLATELDAVARQRTLALATPLDAFRFRGRELYWLRRGRFSDSSDSAITGKALERALGQPTTLRNATTVRKIAAKYS